MTKTFKHLSIVCIACTISLQWEASPLLLFNNSLTAFYSYIAQNNATASFVGNWNSGTPSFFCRTVIRFSWFPRVQGKDSSTSTGSERPNSLKGKEISCNNFQNVLSALQYWLLQLFNINFWKFMSLTLCFVIQFDTQEQFYKNL